MAELHNERIAILAHRQFATERVAGVDGGQTAQWQLVFGGLNHAVCINDAFGYGQVRQ